MNTMSDHAPQRGRPAPALAPPEQIADRLHSAAIHLLRRLREHDAETGLTASRLSALSVVVFAGPIRMGDLAAAEQVRPPSMTRTVRDLEAAGLLRRVPDPDDGRVQRVEATDEGHRLLQEGRRRRVADLASRVADLAPEERRTLARAAELLSSLAHPAEHPRRQGHAVNTPRP